MYIQLHAVSQSTRNLVSFAANYSSTELLCTGSLIHFRFPVLVLRLSRCHQIRDHLPPNGNFLSHLVRRPTSPFHFSTSLRFTLKAFGHCLVMLWPNMLLVLCGLSLDHPVAFPRTFFWKKCVSNNKTSHNRSKVRTMSHSHRTSPIIVDAFSHRICTLGVVCVWMLLYINGMGNFFEDHTPVLSRSDMIFKHNFEQYSKIVFGFHRVLRSFTKIVFQILLFLLVRLQEAHHAISG